MNTPPDAGSEAAAAIAQADDAAAAALRRQKLRAALGNPLPEQTSDDLTPGGAEARSDADYLIDVPPHHGKI